MRVARKILFLSVNQYKRKIFREIHCIAYTCFCVVLVNNMAKRNDNLLYLHFQAPHQVREHTNIPNRADFL